jgi:hypothetical protein
MTYIEKLYNFKKVAFDKIIERERSGFYLINGYTHKFDDIKQLEKIVTMIEKWDSTKKMIWNEITKSMNMESDEIHFKRLSFKEFILKTQIESALIEFRNNADKIKNNS